MLPYILLIIFISCSATAQEVQDTTFIIPLNRTVTDNDRELHSSIINIKALSRTNFIFTNVNGNVSFIIFQAHSHLYNITMCDTTCSLNTMAVGKNIGLYSPIKPIANFFIKNPYNWDLKILIAVHGYTANDPVPGACNLDSNLKVPPNIALMLSSHRDYITLQCASPGLTMKTYICDQSKLISLDFYRMYLPMRDFSIDTYFGGIRAMMDWQYVMENGEIIAETTLRLRRTLSAYPGTGTVLVAIASSLTLDELTNATYYGFASYVPTVTYGCSPEVEDDCMLLSDLLSQVLCASLLFVGLFVCYFGHKFFKTEMFIFGMISGVIVSYIVISLIADMEQAPLLGASFLSGILFGFIWLTFWWFYGIPVFSVLLATLTFGFFASCVLYNQMPGGLVMIMQDLNFWTLFILILLLTAVILTPATYPANILCCAILGAYAAIYPIDYCIGSSLKYIIINTVRRATVENFRHAVLSPPFEKNDALLVLLWVMLATTGFLFQHYHNHGKPPFPPPPRNIRERPEGYSRGATGSPYTRASVSDPPLRPTINRSNERTPLLA